LTVCFSNLPLEFDEEGNPYLAEEADEVERPGDGGEGGEAVHDHGHAADCGCGAGEADLEADPEGAYEAIVDSLPKSARERVAGEEPPTNGDGPTHRPETDAESVGGD
jgi:hypothetical protein